MSVTAFARGALEWRHGWPVRFAHHPLCARHRHETWRVGGAYLCRGCMSLAAGLALGASSAILAGGPWTGAVAVSILPPVLALSWPAWYPALARPLRDLVRVALGLLLAFGAHATLSSPLALWPVLPLGAALWWLYSGRRKRTNARRCDGCPELGHGICSGYAPHAAAMRATAAALEARMTLEGTTEPPMR